MLWSNSRQTIPKSLTGLVKSSYSDSGRLDAHTFSAYANGIGRLSMSTYGGLVPLGFAPFQFAFNLNNIIAFVFITILSQYADFRNCFM